MIRTYHKDGTLPNIEHQVFVFGSNQSGIHGAGAAKVAKDYGAVYGVGFGRQGRTYAIPTKNYTVDTLPLEVIKQFVEAFVDHTKANPRESFFVTRVGCGLAGYTDAEIAPMFREAINCSFAESWEQYLE